MRGQLPRWATSSLLIVAATALIAPDSIAQSQDTGSATHYMCVFAYETTPRNPRTSHTFATFIKTSEGSFEAHTISWLPKSKDVRLLRRFPEPGVNLTLQQTLESARQTEAQVYEWGPFRIKPELYKKALAEIARLQSGKVLYKAIDGLGRLEAVTNCIHAVADLDTERGVLLSGANHGVPSSAMVVEHLRPWIIDPSQRYPSINEKLGLPKNIKGSDQMAVHD